MCLNCGCGQPNETHDDAANITAADLQRAADANGQSLRESAQHIVETLELLQTPEGDDRGLAQPAGPSGAAPTGSRGTPATES
jgi:hypothetical protein